MVPCYLRRLHHVRHLHGQITGVVSTLNDKVAKVLQKQEKEFLGAYRAHMYQVRRRVAVPPPRACARLSTAVVRCNVVCARSGCGVVPIVHAACSCDHKFDGGLPCWGVASRQVQKELQTLRAKANDAEQKLKKNDKIRVLEEEKEWYRKEVGLP